MDYLLSAIGKFHSTMYLRNSAAILWKRKLNNSHFSGVATKNQTYAVESFLGK